MACSGTALATQISNLYSAHRPSKLLLVIKSRGRDGRDAHSGNKVEDGIGMDLGGIGWEDVEWVLLAQDRGQ
jgi:hypothetical protein